MCKPRLRVHQGDRRQNNPSRTDPLLTEKRLRLSQSCGEDNKPVLNLKGSNDDRDECIMQIFSGLVKNIHGRAPGQARDRLNTLIEKDSPR